jgi:hypothetical protein
LELQLGTASLRRRELSKYCATRWRWKQGVTMNIPPFVIGPTAILFANCKKWLSRHQNQADFCGQIC